MKEVITLLNQLQTECSGVVVVVGKEEKEEKIENYRLNVLRKCT